MALLPLREWAAQQKYGVKWDPTAQTVTIGSRAFRAGEIPGTWYDPEAGVHYVVDPTALSRALGTAEERARENISYFGSPAAYAAVIQAKGQQNLADPEAATAFAQMYPQYFQQQQSAQNQPANIQEILKTLGQNTQAAFFPYEQLMRDIMSQMPRYQMPSEEELLRQARQYAELQVSPGIQAVSQALAQTRQALEAQKGQVEAAYTGAEQATQRLMQEAAARALESAIARGGGRSGQVEWYTSRLQQPIAEQFANVQAEKAARLADIAQRMALAEEQAAQQQKALEERRGLLESTQLAELRNLAHATAVGDWQRAFQAAQNLASMAAQAQQWASSFAAGLLPYFTLTEAERQRLPLDWAREMGTVPQPPQPGTPYGFSVPLRAYVGDRATVDYDPTRSSSTASGIRPRLLNSWAASGLAGAGICPLVPSSCCSASERMRSW